MLRCYNKELDLIPAPLFQKKERWYMKKIIFLTVALLIMGTFLFATSDPALTIWNVKSLKAGTKLTYTISTTDFNGMPRFEKVNISALPGKEKGSIWLNYTISNPLAKSAMNAKPSVKIKGRGKVNISSLQAFSNKPVHTFKFLVDKNSETIKKIVAPELFSKPIDLTKEKGNQNRANLMSVGATGLLNKRALFRNLRSPDEKEQVLGVDVVKTPAGVFRCKHIRRESVKTKKVQNGHFVLVTVVHYKDDLWVSDRGKFIGIVKEMRNTRVEHKFQNTLAPNRDYTKLNRVKTKTLKKVLVSFSK